MNCPTGPLLLDTNVIVALLRRRGPVAEYLGQAGPLFLSAVSFGELWHGAEKSSQRDGQLRHLEALCEGIAILDANRHVASVYGRLVHTLELGGRRIPSNDIWIAATALGHDLPLCTGDRHFAVVEGLRLWPLPGE